MVSCKQPEGLKDQAGEGPWCVAVSNLIVVTTDMIIRNLKDEESALAPSRREHTPSQQQRHHRGQDG